MNNDDLATPWRKSSFWNSGANCMEVATTRSGKVAVRDSKNPDGATLTFSPDDWKAFVTWVKASSS